MYRRPTKTKACLITPESTPVKEHYNRLRFSSDTSSETIGFNFPAQRRLPRKPIRPSSNAPEQFGPRDKITLNHPVDFVINMISQSLYHYVYLSLAGTIQEELRPPVRWTYMATTAFSIFVTRIVAVLAVGLCLWLHVIKSLFGVATDLTLLVYDALTDLAQNYRFEIVQSHLIALRDEVKSLCVEKDPSACPSVGFLPSPRLDSPGSAWLSPDQKRASSLSPASSRRFHRTGFGSSARFQTTVSPYSACAAQSSGHTSRYVLGHRAEDLHRILADCNEAQLEAAKVLVSGLQTRAQARAGWKL